jgi:hypothetical protein
MTELATVWVLVSNDLCMGVFRTREAAERHAEEILGGPERRQYEDWIGPWTLEDEDEADAIRVRYVRETDDGPRFVLERIKVSA